MNWANRLTVLRIILVPVFVSCVLYHRLGLALAVFMAAAVTDALDGYLARSRNEKTKLGAIMDPLADKLLIMSAFVSLSLVSGLSDNLRMPVYVPVVVISRDVIILLGAVMIYLHNGKIDIKPTAISKVTTFFQIVTVISVLVKFAHSVWVWNVAVVFTIISGIDYIRIGSSQINGKT
jgi:cardiolipin synthase (CMP-forming)